MTTKKICLTAIGTALFVSLSLCLQVPVFENYYLCLGYVVMMIFCFYFGTFSSLFVAVFGVVLYCLLISGLRGMPGWVAGNVVIAVAVSTTCKYTCHMKNVWMRHLLILGSIMLSTAIGILCVKSLLEMTLYLQPFLLRVAKNVYAFVADVFIMAISLPLCERLKNILHKLFPEETKVMH